MSIENSLLIACNKYKVDEIPLLSKVIEIDSKSTLYGGFQTLLDNKIQSAPVYDASKNAYVGFLDVRDLVSFVRFVYDEQHVFDNATLKDILFYGINMLKAPKTDGVTVSYLARRNKFSPIKQGSSLYEVAILLTEGVHRVPIIDDNCRVVNIISQLGLLGFLYNHLDKSYPPLQKTIQEVNIGTQPVLSVDRHTSFIETLRVMDSRSKSGVAILGEHGRLIGTTTGKDLGLFFKNPTLGALQSHVASYLSELRAEFVDIRNPTITVFLHDKIIRAIGLLVATKVHRIFVIDNETHFRPKAVISISDILKYLQTN